MRETPGKDEVFRDGHYFLLFLFILRFVSSVKIVKLRRKEVLYTCERVFSVYRKPTKRRHRRMEMFRP